MTSSTSSGCGAQTPEDLPLDNSDARREGPASAQPRPLNIVVGVCGGIAAYKACHLVRFFKEGGHNVRVVPTPTALKFVGAATFEALSGQPVATDVFSDVDSVQHVRLGQKADLVVIAPATADFLARAASGRADDLLSSTLLVATCPVVMAPAMHTEMWNHPATRANVATLRSRGVAVLEPAHGRLTGKDSGPGRLLEPEQIGQLALTVWQLQGREGSVAHAAIPGGQGLQGVRVLITAGGTQEAMDPVRFIGNRSSGRMGFALAEIATQAGAEVTVVAASVDERLQVPAGARLVRVESARELKQEVDGRVGETDCLIMAAAVADVRPAEPAQQKLKKGQGDARLGGIAFAENPDILRGVVQWRGARPRPVIVGFAAETGDEHNDVVAYGRAKLASKGCDVVFCNEVGRGKVFGQPTGGGWLLFQQGDVRQVAQGRKLDVAAEIIGAVIQLLRAAG